MALINLTRSWTLALKSVLLVALGFLMVLFGLFTGRGLVKNEAGALFMPNIAHAETPSCAPSDCATCESCGCASCGCGCSGNCAEACAGEGSCGCDCGCEGCDCGGTGGAE